MLNRRRSWCMYPMAVLAVAGAATAGCGPGGEGGDGTGGTGSGSGGAGGGGLIQARGAFSLSFVRSSAACEIASHNMAVGEVDGQMANLLVTDGVNGADINCSVIDTGQGSFAVSAAILHQGRVLDVEVNAISQSHVAGNPASGLAAYASEVTVDTYTGSCDFTVVQQTLAPGNAWLQFACPVFAAEMSTCEISAGYVIVQDCAT